MRLKFEDLTARARDAQKAYLVCGDEPFLIEEAVTHIVRAAEAAGVSDRQRFSLETGFSWPRFREALASPSLFAPRSLYELRVREGRETLGRELLACLPLLGRDVILLVVTGALERSTLKTEWVEAFAEHGHVVMVAAFEGERLVRWVRHCLHDAGVMADDDIAARIAYYAEGNMGAAWDAIMRLKDHPKPDLAALSDIMVDEARFDVFAVTDAALKGDLALTHRYVRRLRAEARDPILMSWALAREVRVLVKVVAAQAKKGALTDIFRRERVWASRQGLLTSAAKRLSQATLRRLLLACARLDRVNKGRADGDSWLLIETIALALAGMAGEGGL